MKFINIILLLVTFSCASKSSLNMKNHEFSSKAKNIIWFQIPGLEMEHFSMLRFNKNVTDLTSFENASCVGSMWTHNLYDLRPEAYDSYSSQMTGSSNIKSHCPSSNSSGVWSYLSELGYKTTILENIQNKKNQIENLSSCEAETPLLGGIQVFSMSKAKTESSSIYHFQEKLELNEGIFFDKTCQQGSSGCLASLSNNGVSIWKELSEKNTRNIFIIRDFSYLDALKRNDFETAKLSLMEVQKLHEHFINLAKSSDDYLVLLTSAESKKIDFPRKGREWEEFERFGKKISIKQSSLTSPAIAYGAGSENFCGVYNENETLKRLIWSPDVKIFNMFKIKSLFD